MAQLFNLSVETYRLILLLVCIIIFFVVVSYIPKTKRLTRRQWYYRNVYLKSDAWRRKRYVVLRRDQWRCVHCGSRATQVHHKRYAKRKLGKEPIKWLESVCKGCHDNLHK
ncbi:HNH endonuclease [Winogradskyella schleiferi]|uniref:HNH endonuclease n=1 Tax=Winogradskyella schleiferi TaxID=2686078 RepID=UPI0015C0ECF3|nr:hypothetical protein [Winogradskyella schleiferi]